MATITTKNTTTNTWKKLRDMPLAAGTEITDTLKDGTSITFEVAARDVYGAKKVLVCKYCLEKEHSMNGVILLIHAMNYPDRTDADRVYTYLGEIIDTLRAKGYDFKNLHDVIAAEKAAQ